MISFNHKIQKKNQFIAQIKYVQSEVVGVPRRRCHPCRRHPTVYHHHCPHHCSILHTVLGMVWWWGPVRRVGGVLRAVLASREVGGGGALCSVLGWHHGRACARRVGGVGVLRSVLRWRHSGACAWRVGIVVGLACHVGMVSWWGLHVASWCCGWILRTVMGWRWRQTCMWQRWRRPGLWAVRQRQRRGLVRLER